MPVADEELNALASSRDIITLGARADDVRRHLHGLQTTFVRVARTSAMLDEPIDCPPAAGEIRIEGAPESCAVAVERVARVVASASGTPVSAFSLADLEQLAARESMTLRALLESLRDVGLELVSEAPIDRLQSARRSIEEANIAGLTVGRLTVHRLSSPDVVASMKAVEALQRDVAVIRAFAPLPRTMTSAVPTTGYDDVRRVALARLIVDNVPSIQVDWALYGPKLAQVALTVGADDVDGVSPEEESAEGRRRSPLQEILRNIRAAGQEPVERNGRFDRKATTE